MEEEKFMTFREVMDYVEGVKDIRSSKTGLFRKKREGNPKSMGISVGNLCEKLGYPQRELSFVCVTGTNGKSSVLALISEVLKAAGYRTGRYFSPALTDWWRKTQVGGRLIGKKEFCRQMTRLKALCQELVQEGMPHPTAHEMEMAMALQYFKEQGCQIVLWETSLDEWNDTACIMPNVLAYVFTAISLGERNVLEKFSGRSRDGKKECKAKDHKIKGSEDGQIAVAIRSQPEIMDVLQKKMEECQIPLIVTDISKASGIKRNMERQIFSCQEYKNLTIPLLGSCQIENAALAVEVLKELKERGFTIPDKAVYKGFAKVNLPGRFQILTKKPYFIVDGVKDAESAGRLFETIRFYFTGRKVIYIVGMQRGTEPEIIARNLCPLAAEILTIPVKGEDGLSSYELACLLREYHGRVTAADSMEEAVEIAFLLADKEAVIIAFGSLSGLGNLIRTVTLKGKIMEVTK